MKILETVDKTPCSKTLTIEVTPEEIGKEIDSVYKELSTNAQIPGFRPGHAPLHLLKLRFGKHVAQEAKEKIVEKACKDALEELKIQPVGDPQVTPKGESKEEAKEEAQEGQEQEQEPKQEEEFGKEPFVFDFEFEFVPPFEVKDYKGLQVEVPKIETTDDQVREVLDSFRERNAILVPAPKDKAIGKEDIVTLAVEATCDGEPFPEATHESYSMEVGFGRHLPGFEDQLIGLKSDEEKTFELEIPEDYSLEKYRGKRAVLEVRVGQINRRELPELDDEFAKDLSFESLDALKEKVRGNLEQQAERQRKDAIRAALRNRLVEDNAIAVPSAMVGAEFNYITALQNMELMQMGSSFDALGDKKDAVLAENRQRAEHRVRATLLLEKIAEAEEVKIGESEFFDYLESVAAAQGTDIDRFAGYVHKKGLEGYYHRLALEDKVLDFLREHATIQEVEPKAAAKSKKESAKKKSAKKKTQDE